MREQITCLHSGLIKGLAQIRQLFVSYLSTGSVSGRYKIDLIQLTNASRRSDLLYS